MKGGSSNVTSMMMVMVMCVCVVSCMMSMMGMGPLGGLFSGASSLIGGAGDLVGGAGKGVGKGLSAAGSVVSGEAFKPKLKKVEGADAEKLKKTLDNMKFGKACPKCNAKNWEGTVQSRGKAIECAKIRPKCGDYL